MENCYLLSSEEDGVYHNEECTFQVFLNEGYALTHGYSCAFRFKEIWYTTEGKEYQEVVQQGVIPFLSLQGIVCRTIPHSLFAQLVMAESSVAGGKLPVW